MKTYTVIITEVLEKLVIIEAENDEEAENKVKEQYYNEEIILDSSNCCRNEFDVWEGDITKCN